MIIKEVVISNYQCYYGEKRFEFKPGSNIILGKNGGGKTKFYEAIDWLFTSGSRGHDEIVSKRKLAETDTGGSFNVGVEVHFENKNVINIVRKYFSVQKEDGKKFSITNIVYEGIREERNGEREIVDGQTLLNVLFPPTNRKFCFFKGESELNILKNKDSLTQLINLYAKVKHYGPYADKGTLFREYADKTVEDAVKKDKKAEKRYKELEFAINDRNRKLKEKQIFLQTTTEEIRKFEENIQGVEKHLDNAEAVETIKNRIKRLTEDRKKTEDRIDESYTNFLFDRSWLLCHFEGIQHEFSEKIEQLSKERRKREHDFVRAKGFEEGEKRAKAALLKGVVPLPTNIPSKAVMQEMLKEQICKVCNREALEGSDAYSFMYQRLMDYIQTQEPAENEKVIEELYQYNFTAKLENLETSLDNQLSSVRSIIGDIRDSFEFNEKRKAEVQDIDTKIEKEEQDFENVIGSSEIGQDSLAQAFKNFKGWQKDLIAANIKLGNLNEEIGKIKEELKELKEEKEKLDGSSASTYLTQTRQVIRDIETIFVDTKERKYDEFIKQLQDTANYYLKKINTGSFTGYIEIVRRGLSGNEIVEVNLMQDGEIFYHPNTSLQTSMHLAVLFAIAQLTKIEREECYPIIFDAPTSSFDPIKRKHFFDVLGDCNEQTILLTKDFTNQSSKDSALLYSDEFKSIKRDNAILIKLEEPFDPEILSTINTQVINL